jgi:hypothetical protein
MPLPRFHLRTLLIAAPVAGVVLAIEAAAWSGSVGQGLGLILLLSIAWVPAVSLLLDPKVAGWLLVLAASASILAVASALYQAARGDLVREVGPICGATLWLTFACGLGYVATKGLHLPDRNPRRDTRPEAVGDAAGETGMAGSPGDPEADEGRPGRPGATADRSSTTPADTTGRSTAGVPTARAITIAAMIGAPALVFLVVTTGGAILTPLAGLLLLAPFVAVNYLLWGRLVAPREPAGRRRRADDERV